MRYAIYPPIGIGRVGNSAQFNLSPERMGSLGMLPDGTDREAGSWKDAAFQVMRMAPRFEIFEIADDGVPRPAVLSQGTTVSWTVSLANKKDAVVRPDNPPKEPTLSTLRPDRVDRVISATGSVSGPDAAMIDLVGSYPPDVRVRLGQLQTDSRQRLVALGGTGIAASPTDAPINQYYTNTGWYDDVSDGPVTAHVTLPGREPVEAAPAWVIFGPPDFAPAATAVVTFRDVIRQLAIDQGWESEPQTPSFSRDIRPIIERAASLRWVSRKQEWKGISTRWQDLARKESPYAELRTYTAHAVKQAVEQMADGGLTNWQLDALQAWAIGNFDQDVPPPDLAPAAERTRAALDVSAGRALDPGIEAGIILLSRDHFLQPFDYRIDHARREPGEMTALMSLPWQADMIECLDGWWPAQRPIIATQADGTELDWARPLSPKDFQGAVSHWMQFGMIVMRDGKGVEVARDPNLRGTPPPA